MSIETAAYPHSGEIRGNGLLPEEGRGAVLIAEDDDGTRDSLAAILRHLGYEVIEAVNGEEAVRTFDRHKERLKLVLLDVVMPALNGREVMDEILAIKPDVRIIFMSGYSADMFRSSGLFHSGYPLLEKPIQLNLLFSTIRDILAEKM